MFFGYCQSQAGLQLSVGAEAGHVFLPKDDLEGEEGAHYQVELVMVGQKQVEVSIGYERCPDIGFDRMYFGVGYQFWPHERLAVIPSLEPTLIGRWGEWGRDDGADIYGKSSHLAMGLSMGIRYDLSEVLGVEYCPQILTRTDLSAKYPPEMLTGMRVGGTPVSVRHFVALVYRFVRL